MLHSIDAKTFSNLQLNAGVFLKNFTYNTATDNETLLALVKTALGKPDNRLGATRGGGSFAFTPTLRDIEVDGKRGAFVGSQVIDDAQIKLSTTIVEMTAENLAIALGSADVTTDDKVKTIKIRTALLPKDYITNIVWVGDLSDGRFAIIDLQNALNTAGATFSFQDKGEGTIPVEFTAHFKDIDNDYFPVNIVIFDKTE